MLRAYTRIIQPFLKDHSNHAEQAFDIPSSKVLPTEVKHLNVSLNALEQIGQIELHLNYRIISRPQHESYMIPYVCEDVERLIYSYLQDSISMTIQMDFTENWPFWGPKVKCTKISNDPHGLEAVVKQFNCDLRSDWSPSLGFDKTLLVLLNRLLERMNYV